MGHCVRNSKRSCVKILILNISFVSPLFFWSFKTFVQKWTFKNTLLMLKSIDFKKEWEFTIKTYHSLRQKYEVKTSYPCEWHWLIMIFLCFLNNPCFRMFKSKNFLWSWHNKFTNIEMKYTQISGYTVIAGVCILVKVHLGIYSLLLAKARIPHIYDSTARCTEWSLHFYFTPFLQFSSNCLSS